MPKISNFRYETRERFDVADSLGSVYTLTIKDTLIDQVSSQGDGPSSWRPYHVDYDLSNGRSVAPIDENTFRDLVDQSIYRRVRKAE